jgi:hypothetical protein
MRAIYCAQQNHKMRANLGALQPLVKAIINAGINICLCKARQGSNKPLMAVLKRMVCGGRQGTLIVQRGIADDERASKSQCV